MNIAIFNGGRGAKNLINVFTKIEGVKISSIVNTLDDGKSTGQIRNIFNMFGPSDIRKVQSLLLNKKNKYYLENKKIFLYRFSGHSNLEILKEIKKFTFQNSQKIFKLEFKEKKKIKEFRSYLKLFLAKFEKKSHIYKLSTWSLMNIFYAGCYLKNKRNTYKTISTIKALLSINHFVYPVTNENLFLSAIRKNGVILHDEASIVEMRSNELIEKIFISKTKIPNCNSSLSKNKKIKYLNSFHCKPSLSKNAELAIKKADIIIYAPGTQHSSLLPSYLTKNLSKTIALNKKALKVFITNIGADYETPNFKASDYINLAYSFLNYNENYSIKNFFDINLVNQPQSKKSNYVKADIQGLSNTDIKFDLRNYEMGKSGNHNGTLLRNIILSFKSK